MMHNFMKRKRLICLVMTICLLISASPSTAEGNTSIGKSLKSLLSQGHTERITNEEPAELPLMITRPENQSVSSLSTTSAPNMISSFADEYITISRPDDGYSCLFAHRYYQFTATVHGSGTVDQAVTWSVSGNSDPWTSINSSGYMQVGSEGATLTITATSATYGISASYNVYAFTGYAYGGSYPTPAIPYGISLTANTVPENQPASTVVGKLHVTTQAIDNPAYRYTLVTDDNNAATTDDAIRSSGNSFFVIEGNTLETKNTLDYDIQQSYSILVKCETYFSSPGNGLVFEDFTINVEPDNTVPTVVLTVPTGSAVPLSSGGITLSFSETVTAVLNGTVSINNGSSNYIYTISAGDNYVTGTGTNCKAEIPIDRFINGVTPLSLTTNTTYTISVSSGAYQDVEGLSIANSPSIGSFTTVKSNEKDMISLSLNAYVGIINAAGQTVAVSVPHGTDITALIPSITVSNHATVAPLSGVAINFSSSNPHTFVVTAEDGTTKSYVVTLTVEPPVAIPVTTAPVPVVTSPKFNFELSPTDLDGSGNLTIPITPKDLRAALSDPTIDNITFTLVLPNEIVGLIGRSSALMLNADVLNSIKEAGKGLSITLRGENNRHGYTWTFSAEQLSSSNEFMTAINLIVRSHPLTDMSTRSKSLSNNLNGNGLILSFSHDRLLPTQATIGYYVGDQEGFTPGRRIYLYHYNPITDKLETLPYSSGYKVNEDGYININIVQGADYVMLLEPAAPEDITSLRRQITVTPSKKALTMGGTTNTMQIIINLPVTLYQTTETSGVVSQNALGAVTVTFSSDNKKVLRVDQRGNVIAMGSGTATIIIKITLYSGKVKTVKTKITVTK